MPKETRGRETQGPHADAFELRVAFCDTMASAVPHAVRRLLGVGYGGS